MIYVFFGVIIFGLLGVIFVYMLRDRRMRNTINFLLQSMKEERFQQDGIILGDDDVEICYEDVKLLIHIRPDKNNKGIPVKIFDMSNVERKGLIGFEYLVPYNYEEATGLIPHATVCVLTSGEILWRREEKMI